eukprot:scaffold4779_cov116-Isochrysis_galbana.AAC.20
MRRLEREKPRQIQRAEVSLSAFDSRALGFQAYRSYCAESLRTLERRFRFYGDVIYWQRRWKMHLHLMPDAAEERVEAVQGCGAAAAQGRQWIWMQNFTTISNCN